MKDILSSMAINLSESPFFFESILKNYKLPECFKILPNFKLLYEYN